MPALQEVVDTYLKLDHSEYSIKTYRSRLKALVEHFGSARPLESITYGDVVDYCHSFKPRLKPTTYRYYQSFLKNFFKWCVEVGYLIVSPAAKLKVQKVDPDPVDRAIPGEVLDAMYERVRRKDYNTIRDYAIIRLIDESACRRIGANLQLSKLDLENMSAVTKEKGGRYVPIFFGPEAARALKSWLALRPGTKFDEHSRIYKSTLSHDYIFVAHRPSRGYPPLKPEAISQMIRRLSETVGDRGYGPHAIRHNTLEEMVEAGEAPNVVQGKANHRHQRTTVDHYYRKDNSLVQLATLRREARRSKKSAAAKIISLYDEDADLG